MIESDRDINRRYFAIDLWSLAVLSCVAAGFATALIVGCRIRVAALRKILALSGSMWSVVRILIALILLTIPSQAEEGPAWDRSLAVGLNLSEGNTETTLANGSLRVVREVKEDYVRFLLEGTYGETDDDTTTQKARGQVQYRRHLKGGFVYTDVDSQHDDPAGVDYRVIAGGGLGRYLSRGEHVRVSAELGLGYLWEKVSGEEDGHVVLRVAQRGSWGLSTTAKVWESVEFIPRAESFDDYLLILEAGIESAITKQIYLRLVAQDRYDSVPAAGVEHNDLSLISALSWRL